MNAGDIDSVLNCLDDNVVWHVDGSVTVPTVGLLRGKQRVRRWLENFPHSFTAQQVVLDTLVADNKDVIAIGHFRHLAHLPRNGEQTDASLAEERDIGSQHRFVDGHFALRFSVHKEKITRYQIYEDSLVLARAFDQHDAFTERNVRLNGTVYAYTNTGNPGSGGQATAIVFAHGLFVDRNIFSKQIQAMRCERRCINFDMPGHGKSGYCADGWSLDDIADDLALFVEESRLGQVVFVGQSQGGMIGMRLAAKYPELVSGLVLIGASARAEYADRMAGWRTLREVLVNGSADERDAALSATQQQARGENWLASHAVRAKKERKATLALDRTGIALALDAAVINREDIRGLLPYITAPTLVLCGEKDTATPLDISREIASGIPQATLVAIPDAGHHLPLEAPEQAADALIRFLSAL